MFNPYSALLGYDHEVHCFGRSGDGNLEWFIEGMEGNRQNDLRDQLTLIAGEMGSFSFTLENVSST